MRLAVLQPVGSGVAQQHYQDTVEQLVSLSKHRTKLGADLPLHTKQRGTAYARSS